MFKFGNFSRAYTEINQRKLDAINNHLTWRKPYCIKYTKKKTNGNAKTTEVVLDIVYQDTCIQNILKDKMEEIVEGYQCGFRGGRGVVD